LNVYGEACHDPLLRPLRRAEGGVMEVTVTDSEIADAFKGTNFGSVAYRKILEQGVLQVACGYSTGHTLKQIMIGLGLTTQKENVTKKGKKFLLWAFYDKSHA